jgi:hypothetical protein
VSHAADILAEQLSGSEIIKFTVAYAVDYSAELPHPTYPFTAPNKRTALFQNLKAFSPQRQYQIIRELCEHATSREDSTKIRELKIKLLTQYGHLASESDAGKLDLSLVVEVHHWLDGYSEVLKLYNEALQKHEHGVFRRNSLDDIRLALEKLTQNLFGNGKSLENQIPAIGAYIKSNGGSKELANMFEKLVDYFTKYQNTYVKHDDAVPAGEMEFIIEITSSFMKHLVRLSIKDKGI